MSGKVVLGGVGVLLALFAFIFVSQTFDLGMTKFFQPKYEAVRHQTFEQSQAYNDGMQRDLEDFEVQYNAPGATQGQKDAIRAAVLHRVAGYQNVDQLPGELRAFVQQLKGNP